MNPTSHHYAFHIATLLLTIFYVFKQTSFMMPHQLYIQLAMVALTIIMYVSCSSYIFELLRNKIDFSIIFLLIFSFLYSSVLFHTASLLISVTYKLILYFIILIYIDKYGINKLLSISDVILLSVISIFILSQASIIETRAASNDNWTKEYIGFINPNIPGYFIFSCMVIYYIQRESFRYYISTLAMLIFWLFFDSYSRTFLVGSLILTFLHCGFPFFNRKILIFLSITSLLLTVTASFLLLFPSVSYNLLSNSLGAKMDSFLSNRLYFLSIQDWSVNWSWPVINIFPIDSFSYELIILFGPISLYIVLYSMIRVIDRTYRNTVTKEDLAIVVILIVGVSEGLIMKYSAMPIFILYYFKQNMKYIRVRDW